MMLGNASWGGSFALWHMGGGLLCLAFLTGLVFFWAWAIKTLKKEDLLKWAVLLVSITLIGWILAMSLGGWSRWGGKGFRGGPGMMWGSYGYDKQ